MKAEILKRDPEATFMDPKAIEDFKTAQTFQKQLLKTSQTFSVYNMAIQNRKGKTKMENNEEIMKIRSHYMEKEITDMDRLRALDKKVRKPADVFAYGFGTVAALTMGAGMSLIMTDVGETLGISSVMVPGLIIGLAGMAMAICNYPIWKHILSARRKKYAGQVVALSNKISQQSDM